MPFFSRRRVHASFVSHSQVVVPLIFWFFTIRHWREDVLACFSIVPWRFKADRKRINGKLLYIRSYIVWRFRGVSVFCSSLLTFEFSKVVRWATAFQKFSMTTKQIYKFWHRDQKKIFSYNLACLSVLGHWALKTTSLDSSKQNIFSSATTYRYFKNIIIMKCKYTFLRKEYQK